MWCWICAYIYMCIYKDMIYIWYIWSAISLFRQYFYTRTVKCLIKVPLSAVSGFEFVYVNVCAYTCIQRGYEQLPFFIKQVTFSCWCSIYLSSFWQSCVPFSQHLTKDQWEKAFWRCFQVLRQGRWSESCHKLQTHLTNEELFWRSVNCCHIS